MNAKLKKFFILSVVVFAVLIAITGCSGVFTNGNTVYTEDEKEYARSQLVAANEEAMTLLHSSVHERSQNAETDECNLENIIVGAAWMALYTEDYDSFIKLLKEYNLYSDVVKIIKKYNVEEQEKILNTENVMQRSPTNNLFTDSSLRTGDIFLCSAYASGASGSSGGSIVGIFIPGEWKHAGLFVKERIGTQYPIISASNFTDAGFAVGYDNVDKWLTRKKVQVRRVVNSTPVQGINAVNYVTQFYGKPYGLTNKRDTNDKWYCSKIVYRAWLDQGYNVEADSGKKQGLYVTPLDIHNDPDTYYLMGDF